MDICLSEWADIVTIKGNQAQMMYVESLCHKTNKNLVPKYDFDSKFYKMPSYIRRASISEAIGKVSSYKSNLGNWENNPIGKKPPLNTCGYVYPSLYRVGMYNQTGSYSAQIKIFRNNTWDWLTVDLRKSDMDYIYRRCSSRKICAPRFRNAVRNGFWISHLRKVLLLWIQKTLWLVLTLA